MSAAGEQFQTAVRGVEGVWPAAPSMWSYSSLSEAEGCPRRWMLSRARYPTIWEREGYPPRPILAGLLGNVMHRALEVILGALQARGCVSVSDPCAVEALRDIGGFSRLLEDTIEAELETLQRNPRATERLASIRERLLREMPAVRERLQATISRTHLHPSSDDGPIAGTVPSRGGLVRGSHPEVELRAEGLRLMGRADLITIKDGGCAITDYKTGVPSERHAEQLRFYAVLWSRDRQVNPEGLPVKSLVVAYATHDETLDGPSADELEMLAGALSERIAKAECDLSRPPAPAYPAPEVCRNCSVRHLCDDYWLATRAAPAPEASSQAAVFVDCEAVIATRNGPRSWLLSLGDQPERALLRTATETPGFAAGDSVRILGLALSANEDSAEMILTMTQFSEVFVLRGQAQQPGIVVAPG
jgi:PD-(D/E)XK nuclease superfamily